MKAVHEGLSYQSFTYPYLAPNTGVFGIADQVGVGDGSIFLPEDGDVEFPGLIITDGYQPEIYTSPDNGGYSNDVFIDGGFSGGNSCLVIFG